MSWLSKTVSKAVNSVKKHPIELINPSAGLASLVGMTPESFTLGELAVGAGALGAGALMGGGAAGAAAGGAGATATSGAGLSSAGGVLRALGGGAGLLGPLLGAGASIYGSQQQAEAQREANEANIQLAREQMLFSSQQAAREMDFQERMSNTSYQRGIEDMKKAGINPIMAAGNGGASTPGGAMGSGSAPDIKPVPSVVANALSSAVDVIRTYADVNKSFADADASRASAHLSRENIPKVRAETGKTIADTEGSKFEQRTFKLFNDLFDRIRSAWDNSAKKPGGIPFGPSFDGNPFYK